MKISKPLAFCLSFSWATSLVDLYAAFQTDYWPMLYASIGVRMLMTLMALAWCVHLHRCQKSHDELVAKCGHPSREAVPPVSAEHPRPPLHRTEIQDAGVRPPVTEPDLDSSPEHIKTDSDIMEGHMSESRQPVMG